MHAVWRVSGGNMSVRIKQTNPNWLKRLERRYDKDYAIKVGYPASKTKSIEYPDGTSLVQVAMLNNFGSSSQNIPARPFMRLAKPAAIKVIKKPLKKMTHFLNTGKMTKKRMAEILAPLAVAEFKKTITNLREPPNAPSTIAAKRSSNPLIDTGLLRNSLTSVIVKMKKNGEVEA